MIAAARLGSRNHGGESAWREGGGDEASPISLRVRDLTSSRRFYSEVLGFVPSSCAASPDPRSVLVSPMLASGLRSIVLTRTQAPHEANGLLLELETTGELLDRYILARLNGAPTSGLVSRGRMLMTRVQDPDGHWIELRAARRDEHGRNDEDRRTRRSTSRWARYPEIEEDGYCREPEAGPGDDQE
jgi:catechol-2,3-dioxygenase